VKKAQGISLMCALAMTMVISGFVCRSGDALKDSDGTHVAVVQQPATAAQTADTTIKPAADTLRNDHPTTIKANISHITATVKSVVIVDTVNFHATVHIDSSSAIGEMASFAEPGAEISLSPRYFLEANGSIDIANDRNKRLVSLRSLSAGAMIHGKIVRTLNGIWEIVDLDR
jgi:hypothetical protein